MTAPEPGGYPRYNAETDNVEWVDNPPSITNAIAELASAANAAANAYRGQAEANPPASYLALGARANELAAATDALTTAIADALA